MTQVEITGIIAEVLSDKLNVDATRITPPALLREELGADSISALEIAFELEDKFQMEIPEADMQSARTVDDLIQYVSAKTTVQAQHAQSAAL